MSRKGSRAAAWWILGAIVLHISLWTAWLAFAGHHPVQEVPLATGGRS
jgi:hypothetical protein